VVTANLISEFNARAKSTDPIEIACEKFTISSRAFHGPPVHPAQAANDHPPERYCAQLQRFPIKVIS